MSREKGEKRVPPRPRDRTGSLVIDPALTGGFRTRRNPLDAELEAEDSLQARELRDLRVQELIERRRARIAKLRKEIDRLEGGGVAGTAEDREEAPVISLSMARQLAKLPEEERLRVLETYAMVRSLGSRRGDAVLPLLVGYARANPGASQGQMLEYAKAMNEQLKTGIEIGRGERAQTPDPWRPLEILKDLIAESVRKPLVDAIRQLQPQPSVFEQILLDDRLFNRARELGLFGRSDGGAGRSEVDLEIERLRGERELQIKKLELEMQKALLEHRASERRTETLLGAIAPLGTLFAGPIDQKMRRLGRQTAGRASAPAPPKQVKSERRKISAHIACDCGYEGDIEFDGAPPPSVRCPECGKELTAGGRGQEIAEVLPSEAAAGEEGSPEDYGPVRRWGDSIHPRPAYVDLHEREVRP